MRKLQKSFLKKTLEVYHSQTITKISTTTIDRQKNKIERKIIINTGNGKKHHLRFKHFSNNQLPLEWQYYKNEKKEEHNHFLPNFLMGSKLNNGEIIYFLKDYPHDEKINYSLITIKKFINLLSFLKETFYNKLSYETNYNSRFIKFLKSKKKSNLIKYYNQLNSNNNIEISCIYSNKNLIITDKTLKLMDINNLKRHIPGFSYWSLFRNVSNINFLNYITKQIDQLNLKPEILRELSNLEYNFCTEYEKKEY